MIAGAVVHSNHWRAALAWEGDLMATIVTGEELRQAAQEQTFIKGGDPDSAEGVKYDFHLGSQILMAGGSPVDTAELTQLEKSKLVIEPGEVVFALTEERLELPPDTFAQLSPKRKISHAGVLTIGGFCVDPGYHGYLLLGLYNFSSTPFKLMPGRKVIAATFHRLQEGEAELLGKPPESLEEFPPDLVQTMEKYKPEGSQTLFETLRRLEGDLLKLRAEVDKHDRFEETLKRHDQQIEKLLTSLSAERDARLSGEDQLSQSMQQIQKSFNRWMGAAAVVGGIVTLLLIPILGQIIWEWLKS